MAFSPYMSQNSYTLYILKIHLDTFYLPRPYVVIEQFKVKIDFHDIILFS